MSLTTLLTDNTSEIIILLYRITHLIKKNNEILVLNYLLKYKFIF